MNFSAVQGVFKPVSSAELERLARKHAGPSRGEQSISLEEVGIDGAAREVLARAQHQPAPVLPRSHEA